MKLYLSKGHIWTGTQADAKAAQGGVNYQTIEVPTDKPGLMAWLNERFGSTEAVEEPVDDAVEPVDDEELPAPVEQPKRPRHKHADMEGHGNGYCASCGRTAVGHHMLKQGDIQDAVIDGINKLDQGFALNNVADALEARGTELGL